MPPMKFKKAQPVKSSKKPPARSRIKASGASSAAKAKTLPFGQTLRVEALVGLTAELAMLRQYPPVVQRSPGKYEGDILGFVRGLRLSARVLYFLREHLSDTGFEVCWGHLLSANEDSCSPECDIVVHDKGLVKRWNGFENPVMNFSFVRASSARVVVSCKSVLSSIDPEYPKSLAKHGVKQVFLFAETCRESQLETLRRKARAAGYAGVWCLYTTEPKSSMWKTNEAQLIEFGEALIAAAKKARDKAAAANKTAAKKAAAAKKKATTKRKAASAKKGVQKATAAKKSANKVVANPAGRGRVAAG